MDFSQIWMNFGVLQEQEDPELMSLPFSIWPCDFENLFAPPPMQEYYSDPMLPNSQDSLQDNFSNIFGVEDAFWGEIIMDPSMLTEEDISIEKSSNGDDYKLISNNGDHHVRAREERVLTFEEVSRYFSMPIVQAAKELNIGLTLLKKKCRDLGIPRWPHRKMKSMQTLIQNVQELGRHGRSGGDLHVRSAIEILEQEKKLMEIEPSIEMQEKTKRLRQACFKANYKKRRLMALHGMGESKLTEKI